MQRAGMWVNLALLALFWAGCGDDGGNHPPPPSGTLSLIFAPTPPSVPNLTLTQIKVRVENLAVFGDVAPDARTMWSGGDIDVLGGRWSYSFDQAPQGLYSRVRFEADRVAFQGTYGSRQIQGQIEIESGYVDLRDPNGQQVGPDSSASFTVGIDANAWFAGVDLSSAVGDQIQIDWSNNYDLAVAIASRVPGSFTLQPAVH